MKIDQLLFKREFVVSHIGIYNGRVMTQCDQALPVIMLCDIVILFHSPVCLPNHFFSYAFFRKRPVPSVWATLLEYSTSLSGALVWPCWWLWLSSVTSQGLRRNGWRWQRMHRILTHLPRRIHRILQLIRKVTTCMASRVLKFRG